jgi:drug/metabolite transporter (DMT)-like permease
MNPTLLGWAAALAMVFIGSGWQLATRHGASGSFLPLDLALLRYAVPALLLAPVWWRLLISQASLQPKRSTLRMGLVAIGAGLPFGLLVMTGARYAPVSHMAALLPGLMPLMVIAGASCMARQMPARRQLLAGAVVFAGVSLVSGCGLRRVARNIGWAMCFLYRPRCSGASTAWRFVAWASPVCKAPL